MNPDYYDAKDEMSKWYNGLKKKCFDDYFIDDDCWGSYSNHYSEYLRKNNYNMPEQPQRNSSPIDLKAGQLVRFQASMGIIIDKAQDNIQVMLSDGRVVKVSEQAVQVIS